MSVTSNKTIVLIGPAGAQVTTLRRWLTPDSTDDKKKSFNRPLVFSPTVDVAKFLKDILPDTSVFHTEHLGPITLRPGSFSEQEHDLILFHDCIFDEKNARAVTDFLTSAHPDAIKILCCEYTNLLPIDFLEECILVAVGWAEPFTPYFHHPELFDRWFAPPAGGMESKRHAIEFFITQPDAMMIRSPADGEIVQTIEQRRYFWRIVDDVREKFFLTKHKTHHRTIVLVGHYDTRLELIERWLQDIGPRFRHPFVVAPDTTDLNRIDRLLNAAPIYAAPTGDDYYEHSGGQVDLAIFHDYLTDSVREEEIRFFMNESCDRAIRVISVDSPCQVLWIPNGFLSDAYIFWLPRRDGQFDWNPSANCMRQRYFIALLPGENVGVEECALSVPHPTGARQNSFARSVSVMSTVQAAQVLHDLSPRGRK